MKTLLRFKIKGEIPICYDMRLRYVCVAVKRRLRNKLDLLLLATTELGKKMNADIKPCIKPSLVSRKDIPEVVGSRFQG